MTASVKSVMLNVFALDAWSFTSLDVLVSITDTRDLTRFVRREMLLSARDVQEFLCIPPGRIPLPDPVDKDSLHRAFEQLPTLERLPRTFNVLDKFPNPSSDDLHLVVRGDLAVNVSCFRLDTQELLWEDQFQREGRVQRLLSRYGLQGKEVSFFKPARWTALPSHGDTLELDTNWTPVSHNDQVGRIYPRGFSPNQLHFLVQVTDSEPADDGDHVPELPSLERRRRFFETTPAKSPSSEGQPSEFRSAQMIPTRALLCGRPLRLEHKVPASLLDENLCRFRHDLHTITPSPEDIKAFQNIRNELTDIFPLEEVRRNMFTSLLNASGIVPDANTRIERGHIGKYDDNGDLRVVVNKKSFIYYIQELKNEVSSTNAEPFFEVMHYFKEQVRAYVMTATTPNELQNLNFPAILLVHFGPYISVAAAAYTDQPVVETLACIPLHVHSTNDEELLAGQRLVASLRLVLRRLRDYYLTIFNPNLRRTPAGYPFRDFFEVGEGLTKRQQIFGYEEAVEDKRVFRGRLEDADGTRVYIKFTRRYCAQAHEKAYTLGFAPKLLKIEDVYSWTMVIMEDVSDEYAPYYVLKETLSPEQQAATCAQMRVFLSRLHGAGYVHGDVRDVNMLIPKSREAKGIPGALLVDWDWAGKEREATYPYNLNPDVARPGGVKAGGPILREHDIGMVSFL